MRFCADSRPRIRDELAKLELIASTATIRKYRPKFRGKPSQGWRTFLQNHAGSMAAMDFFVVPTVTFMVHYHRARPHRSLSHDSPIPRTVESPARGKVIEMPRVGGLHHQYLRQAA